ncbi:MAG TPA: hypothetical protein VKD43_17500 [Xanthobacteraceae bacterium]|nr:hypothetical protein [Xanthobacteraceae bacterium]
MQGGLGRPAAKAAKVGIDRLVGAIGVLLMGLTVSACVSTGQIANLIETRRTTVAFESIDGPPPAVFQKLVQNLKDEASSRQIAVVAPSEANYRLRGYLAAQGGDGATSIVWVLDVYDSSQRRAFRLSGEERATGRAGSWAAADEQVLARIARASMDRFTAFLATAGTSAAAASPPRAASTSSGLGWPDDWTPEASGIFRIFKREPSRTAEVAADDAAALPPEEVPLPRGRPAPAPVGSAGAFAFAPEDR